MTVVLVPPDARRCVYCSAKSGRSLACPAHRDLLKIDPHYLMPKRVAA